MPNVVGAPENMRTCENINHVGEKFAEKYP